MQHIQGFVWLQPLTIWCTLCTGHFSMSQGRFAKRHSVKMVAYFDDILIRGKTKEGEFFSECQRSDDKPGRGRPQTKCQFLLEKVDLLAVPYRQKAQPSQTNSE